MKNVKTKGKKRTGVSTKYRKNWTDLDLSDDSYKKYQKHAQPVDHIEKQMIWDTNQYLVDDILTKVDRSSMNVGLDVRVPFLNKDLYEASWRIPFDLKIYNGTNKWILKQILYKYIPEIRQ